MQHPPRHNPEGCLIFYIDQILVKLFYLINPFNQLTNQLINQSTNTYAFLANTGFFLASVWSIKSASPNGLSFAKSIRIGAATKMDE